MGAADVVPGVSGGTIAFISGIYDELLDSINAVNFQLLKVFKKEGITGVWKKVNGQFLIALIIGILISVISLAKLLSYALEHKPVLVWSFFFGLVLASIIYVAKQVKRWKLLTVVMLLLGAIVAFYITEISPPEINNPSHLYLMLSGGLAICAMILPGVSGAFILVLLGVYAFVLNAIHSRDLSTIFWVGSGAVIGLLTFSRILKYLLSHYRNLTLATLTGFIIGSLNKIWPWKEVLEQKLIEGKWKVIDDRNILPQDYEGDAQLLLAILLMITGFVFIILLEKWAEKK